MGAAMLVLLSRGDAALLGDVYDAGATHFLISPFGAVELGNAIRFTERYARRLGSTSRRTRDFDTRAAEAPAGWRMATVARDHTIPPALGQMIDMPRRTESLPMPPLWRWLGRAGRNRLRD